MAEGSVTPTVCEEMAWSFASRVVAQGIVRDARADAELARSFPRASDRRAIAGLALLRGWLEMETRDWGATFYVTGPHFYRDMRARHERLHGIGSAPREEWEDGSPPRLRPSARRP